MPPIRLQELREEDDLSRRGLARKLGVHPSTVGRWEAGKQGISDIRKQELAELFGVSVAYLMGWERPADGNGETENAA